MINLKFQEIMGFLLGPEMGEERLGICYPSIDVYESSDDLFIEMEIPGVMQEDVNVEIIGNTLRISGMKKDPLSGGGVRYIRMERSFGGFSRELEIPERFNLENIDAKFKDGVLTVRIARSENKVEMVKRIEVK
ncbi:MAG TPA: Hsp20/alpha crystallin family protein [Desulfomonilia bacterium]|jgi:HSP20 family protein